MVEGMSGVQIGPGPTTGRGILSRRYLRLGPFPFAHPRSARIARGSGRVQFGGPKGRILPLKAGDIAFIPAATGHQCRKASDDFLVVGAYPPTGTYNECTTQEDRKKALTTIPKAARPRKDPAYGKHGPLLKALKNPRRSSRGR
jgi:uncharacterized protein YjlB